MPGRNSRQGLGVGLLALMMCVLPPQAAVGSPYAAVNHVGTLADQPEVNCQPDDMWVSRPTMQPAAVQYNPPGFAHGDPYSIPPQWVAFQANLAWWNGSQWVAYRYGTWFYQQASTAPVVLGIGTPWFEWDTGNPASYAIGFWDLPNSGDYANPNYYAVYYHYVWFKDQYRDGGEAIAWTNNHKDNRSQPVGTFNYVRNSSNYCKYPGPNWIEAVY